MAGPSQTFWDNGAKLILSSGLIGGCGSPAVVFTLRSGNPNDVLEYFNVLHRYGGVDRGSACSKSGGNSATITCIKEGGIPGARTEVYIVYKLSTRGQNQWPVPSNGPQWTTVPVSCDENRASGIRPLSEEAFLSDDSAVEMNADGTVATTEGELMTETKANIPMIVGIAVGGVVLIALVLAAVIYRRKQTTSQVHTARATRDTAEMA